METSLSFDIRLYLLVHDIDTSALCVRDRSSRDRCSSRLASVRCSRTSRSKCICSLSLRCICHRSSDIDLLQKINHRKIAELEKCTASLSQRQLSPLNDAPWLNPMKPATTRRNVNKFHLILTCCHSKVNFTTASELTNCRSAVFIFSSFFKAVDWDCWVAVLVVTFIARY